MHKAKAIILLSLAGLLLVAVLVLVFMNMGDTWSLHLYYREVVIRRGVLLLLTALLAVGLWYLLKWMLPIGIHSLRAAQRISRDQKLKQQKRQEQQQPKPQARPETRPDTPKPPGPTDQPPTDLGR